MIDSIFLIINKFGHLTYGEDVSQLEHVLQCGYLALEDDAPPSLVAAALLHDIGQFIDDAGNAAEKLGIDARHEVVGADYLGRCFPPSVTEPIRLHVDAKRYLCAVEPGYEQALSGASALSLRLQGGAMNAEEIERFRQGPHFDAAVRLRRYDDGGKKPETAVPDLESYRPMLQALMHSA
ncbi:phosphohydrolase [Altererythrobacter xixiisoli]|uniref:Phosphohydrolase n=1 Tax=Croceibacterium xixiisoli TaxID=1476466 RepID=A0A6I4TXG1_9SPHN|nr:phosphohydrolase [Croceibacterium xixiisoli]MXP00603.1 phosphohydrolase [Croceibacterium xixiisoli]